MEQSTYSNHWRCAATAEVHVAPPLLVLPSTSFCQLHLRHLVHNFVQAVLPSCPPISLPVHLFVDFVTTIGGAYRPPLSIYGLVYGLWVMVANLFVYNLSSNDLLYSKGFMKFG